VQPYFFTFAAMEQKQYIFGIRAILEAISSSNTTLDKVFIQKNTQGDLMKQLVSKLNSHSISFSYVPVEKLNKLSKGNHQGAIAVISPVKFYEIETLISETFKKTTTPLFLVLDQISDARNFGAIIRTAACTGVDGIIIQKNGAAPVNADTIKTSAGAVFQIPICKVDHIKDALFHLQASEIVSIAATEKTDSLLYTLDLKQPLAIIMGSEDKGINPSVLKIVDYKAKLPMLGGVSSLNVSVACGAFLYETIRQRLD
jgi:23S rRNA (guanosine2251-2'-O)-methyltransferase